MNINDKITFVINNECIEYLRKEKINITLQEKYNLDHSKLECEVDNLTIVNAFYAGMAKAFDEVLNAKMSKH